MRSSLTNSVHPGQAIQSGAAPARTSVDAAVRTQLRAFEPGRVFSPANFASLGSRAALDKVLSRLTAGGELRRIARGL